MSQRLTDRLGALTAATRHRKGVLNKLLRDSRALLQQSQQNQRVSAIIAARRAHFTARSRHRRTSQRQPLIVHSMDRFFRDYRRFLCAFYCALSAIPAAHFAHSIRTSCCVLAVNHRRAQHGQSSQGAMDATSHSSSVAAQRRPSGRHECRCRSSNPHRLRTSPPHRSSQRLADLEGSAH